MCIRGCAHLTACVSVLVFVLVTRVSACERLCFRVSGSVAACEHAIAKHARELLRRLRVCKCMFPTLVKWPEDQQFWMDLTEKVSEELLTEANDMSRSKTTSEPIDMEAFRSVSMQHVKSSAAAVKVQTKAEQGPSSSSNFETAATTGVAPPPRTPMRTSLTHQSPVYSTSDVASPKPSSAVRAADPMINDPSYVKTMNGLLGAMSKAYNSWTTRKREFQLAVTKSKNSATTGGSILEQKLNDIVVKGDEEYAKLFSIEEKYVLNVIIGQAEQASATTSMDELAKLAKAGGRTKLS